jgi:hypothetical protein
MPRPIFGTLNLSKFPSAVIAQARMVGGISTSLILYIYEVTQRVERNTQATLQIRNNIIDGVGVMTLFVLLFGGHTEFYVTSYVT